jgi:hypothetical protein
VEGDHPPEGARLISARLHALGVYVVV